MSNAVTLLPPDTLASSMVCEQGWAKGWHARQLVKLITEARDLLRTAIASRRLNNLESALAVANFLPIVVREASQAEALVTRLHREAAVAKHIAGTCARDTRQHQDLLNALAAPLPPVAASNRVDAA